MDTVEWFSGSITEALEQYQKIHGMLLVYIHHPIEDNDSNTILYNDIWGSFSKEILGEIPAVLIKLVKGSPDANQFAAFFPTPLFPVCYLIGLDGQPLEVITTVEGLDVLKFEEGLKKGIKLYHNQLKEKGIVLKIAQEDGGTSSSNPNLSESDKKAIEDRIQYAKERLEEKRKADAIKNEEEQRQKELERRNQGKQMLESREKQRQRELLEASEARRREKEEDAAILKRLREQIRIDKEERIRKNAGTSETTATVESEVKKAKLEEDASKSINKPVDVDECKIQCKFPDGSTLIETFPSKSPLQLVHNFVKEDGRLPRAFFLVQPFPRRQLTNLSETLIQLGLTPSSCLLVVPAESDSKNAGNSGALNNRNDYFSLLFGFLYTPLVAIFRFVTSLFNFNASGPQRTASEPEPSHLNPNAETNERKKSRDMREAIRREGNIGRLRNENDSSDNDEATWNGNSTQQL